MGRPAGSPNKDKKQLLRALQKIHPDYSPLTELLKLAFDEDTTIGEKISCHKEIAQYIYPKLKSIEQDNTSSDGSMTPRPDKIELIGIQSNGNGSD